MAGRPDDATIDSNECLRRGAIGALGSVPGTVAAHPLDLIKVRQQVDGVGVASAVRQLRGSGVYRGVTAGVGQKVLTRGPMFLVSELCTQLVQSRITQNRDVAVLLGSAASGYITGFCAAPAEWAKVQRGMGGAAAAHSWLVRDILRSGASRHGLARCHGAACRNALFDATFFATEHAARQKAGAPPALSYGCAAALAVILDFPLDMTVKRWMAVPPAQQLSTL